MERVEGRSDVAAQRRDQRLAHHSDGLPDEGDRHELDRDSLVDGLGRAHEAEKYVILREFLAQLVDAAAAAADDAQRSSALRLGTQARQHPVGGRAVVTNIGDPLLKLGRNVDCVQRPRLSGSAVSAVNCSCSGMITNGVDRRGAGRTLLLR